MKLQHILVASDCQICIKKTVCNNLASTSQPGNCVPEEYRILGRAVTLICPTDTKHLREENTATDPIDTTEVNQSPSMIVHFFRLPELL